MKNNLIKIVLFVLICVSTNLILYAYDRKAVIRYADDFTEEKTGVAADDGKYNNLIYYKYAGIIPPYQGSDCANFVSQCLIAGGIRFRSVNFPGDTNNRDNVIFWKADERKLNSDTGYMVGSLHVVTREIKNDNLVLYSRTSTTADDTFISLVQKHGGIPFNNVFPVDDHPEWKKLDASWDIIKEGDVAVCNSNLKPNNYPDPFHMMVIKSVIKPEPGIKGDFLFDAHSKWRKDHSYRMHDDAGIPDDFWLNGTSPDITFIHLPDAPLITNLYLKNSGINGVITNEVNFYFENQETTVENGYKVWHGSGEPEAGRQDLIIELTFDTKMRGDITVGMAPDNNNSPIKYFYSYKGGGYDNQGWTTNKKSWRGKINASDIPKGLNVYATIQILAYAEDGSMTDTRNGLEDYYPGKCSLFHFKLNTIPANVSTK